MPNSVTAFLNNREKSYISGQILDLANQRVFEKSFLLLCVHSAQSIFRKPETESRKDEFGSRFRKFGGCRKFVVYNAISGNNGVHNQTSYSEYTP